MFQHGTGARRNTRITECCVFYARRALILSIILASSLVHRPEASVGAIAVLSSCEAMVLGQPSFLRYAIGSLVIVIGIILPFALSMLRKKKPAPSSYRRLRTPAHV
jgi:hypothetical protein